jgi:hypothetical protein
MYPHRLRDLIQLFFNLGQSCLKSGAAMRIRCPLVEDLLTLQFEGLALPLFVGLRGRGLPVLLRSALTVSLPVRHLFLDGFALPTPRHTLMLMPILARP